VPRPLLRPQTAQNCGSYSFDARIKILIEMYCSYQYLSIDSKKKFATPTISPTNRPQSTHKLQKIVSMNADISETIKDGELRFQI